MFENLETRRLFDATATYDGTTGTIIIEGTNKSDDVRVEWTPGAVIQVFNVGDAVPILSIHEEVVNAIEAYLGNGDDRLVVDTTFDNGADEEVLAYGGNGDDIIITGNANDNLNGGNGKDFLSGGAGNDELHGGNGKDVLEGGSGFDFFDGGNGDDEALDVIDSGGL